MAIDWEAALGFVDGREELLLELIDIFFTEYAEIAPRIARAIESRDAAELHLYAHRLKGCLRYFGASPAGDTAWQLEMLGRSGTLDGAPELLVALRAAIDDEMLPSMRAYQEARRQA